MQMTCSFLVNYCINVFNSCYFQRFNSYEILIFFKKKLCYVISKSERAELESAFQVLDQSW